MADSLLVLYFWVFSLPATLYFSSGGNIVLFTALKLFTALNTSLIKIVCIQNMWKACKMLYILYMLYMFCCRVTFSTVYLTTAEIISWLTVNLLANYFDRLSHY